MEKKNIDEVLTDEKLNKLARFVKICSTVYGCGLDEEQQETINALIAFYVLTKINRREES